MLDTAIDALGGAIAPTDPVKLIGTIVSIDTADTHQGGVVVALLHPVTGFPTTIRCGTKQLEAGV